jgi:DNA-binding winged helix-turn-helix (wHTH) protein
MRYAFGEFVLDTESRLVYRGGEPQPIPPKALALIEILVNERPRAVSKRELMQRLWPDVAVADGSLKTLVAVVRSVLSDANGPTECVRTVHRFGYAFAADVRIEEADASPVRYEMVGPAGHFMIRDGTHTVGRARDCGIRIDARSISRHHARLIVTADRAVIEDLGSKNGTQVDGRRINAATELVGETYICFGSIALAWRPESAGASTISSDALSFKS